MSLEVKQEFTRIKKEQQSGTQPPWVPTLKAKLKVSELCLRKWRHLGRLQNINNWRDELQNEGHPERQM